MFDEFMKQFDPENFAETMICQCGGGGDGGGGPSANQAITSKMNSDNSATQQAYNNAVGNENAWSNSEVNSHAAWGTNRGVNGWPDSRTGSIGGCSGCHQGKYDTH